MRHHTRVLARGRPMFLVALACAWTWASCLPDIDLSDEPGASPAEPPPRATTPVVTTTGAGGSPTDAGATPSDARELPPPPAGPDDGRPPTASGLAVEVDECVRFRLSSDEPARATFLVRAGDWEARVEAGTGTTFAVTVRLPDLPPASDAVVTARLVDGHGHATETGPVPLRTPGPRPRIAITELLANPAGPEPQQEWVELANLGEVPVDLGGLTLEDGAAADVLPQATFPPGARALIVSAAFDPALGPDPVVPPDVLLVRVEGRLGRDGLGNAGEPVRLRMPDGTIVSSHGGGVDVSKTAWNGRSLRRDPEDACDVPEAWPPQPAAPTPGR